MFCLKKERTSGRENVEKKEPSCTVGGNITGAASMETVWRVLKKLKIELPYNPAIPRLDIFPKKIKTLITKDNTTLCLL